jgi:hypothetical protein
LKTSTDASLFQRLYTHLERQKLIQVLTKIGSENFEQIKNGSILELVGEIELSKMEIVMEIMEALLLHSQLIGQQTDEKTKQLLSLLKIMQIVQRSVSIKIVLQDKSYNVVATLMKDNLRVPKQNLSGEFRVFCRVQRKLKEGETFDLFSFLPGMKLPKEFIQKIVEDFNKNENLVFLTGGKQLEVEDFRVGYPAIVVTPVAIYR